MYIYKKKSKHTYIYYLCKSYRDINSGKNSSKIIERIGTAEEIEKISNGNSKEWLDSYLEKWNTKSTEYNIEFNETKKISRKKIRYYNAGYFALQKICYTLKLNKICEDIKKKSGFTGDLTKILLTLIFDRIISPDEDDSYLKYTSCMVGKYSTTKKELMAGIKVLAKYNSYIQTQIYKNGRKKFKYDCSTIFNECLNFCFDIYQNGIASQNIIQADIFFDKNGIPLCYFNNSNYPTEENIKETLFSSMKLVSNNSKILSFTDNLPSNIVKVLKETNNNCKFIKDINIRILKPEIKKWLLDESNWKTITNGKVLTIEEIKNILTSNYFSLKKIKNLENTVLYKSCKIQDDHANKNLIVGFNALKRNTDRLIRNSRYQKMKELIDNQIINNRQKDPEKFRTAFNKVRPFLKEDVLEDSFLYEFDNDSINNDIIFDGYEVCLADSDIENCSEIMNARFSSWINNYMFQNMLHEFKIISKTVNKSDCINVHLLVSFLSLLITKILSFYYFKNNYSLDTIRKTMQNHNFIKIPGTGWIPAFLPNEINDILDHISQTKTGYEFLSEEKMKKFISKTKI